MSRPIHSPPNPRFLALSLAIATLPGPVLAADFVIGNFESGLDPNLVAVTQFNGPVPDGATRGTAAGSFTSPSGWNMYLRYDNGNKAAGNLAGELAYYNDIAFDITVPAGSVPESFFVHEAVFNASVFGWNQSGNLIPAGGTADLKGAGTVTLSWPYRQRIANFDDQLAQYMATENPYFQAILISNFGNGWDAPAYFVDNWRLTRYLGDANLDGTVNGDDYALTDRGAASGLSGWENGDFNLDGSVNAADYLLLDRGLAHQSGVLSPDLLQDRAARFGADYVAQLVTAVPEPTLALLMLPLLPLTRRPRRTTR